MHARSDNSISDLLKRQMLKAILGALPIAIIAIGAADVTNLPAVLQHLVSHLDITLYLPPEGLFADQTHAFEYWVLPINAAFYSAVLFLLSLWRSARLGSTQVPAADDSQDAPSGFLKPNGSNPSSPSELVDPHTLRRQLQLLPDFQRWGPLKEFRVRVLKQRGNDRCTFEITFRSSVVGKVYTVDRLDVYQYMQALAQIGFTQNVEYSIPHPIAYLPGLRLLLQERIDGVPVKWIFKSGNRRERAEAAKRCAGWLAHFHELAPHTGRLTTPDKLLTRCERKCLLIAGQAGPMAAQALTLMERLKAARSVLGEVPVCAGHGDYGTYQIILGARRTVVLDWDLYDITDPARDVARFLISLERQALHQRGSLHALEDTSEIFLRTYLASSGNAQVADRLPFYKAAFCLRGACYDIYDRLQPRPDWAENMLDAGLRYLDPFQQGPQRNIVPERSSEAVATKN